MNDFKLKRIKREITKQRKICKDAQYFYNELKSKFDLCVEHLEGELPTVESRANGVVAHPLYKQFESLQRQFTNTSKRLQEANARLMELEIQQKELENASKPKENALSGLAKPKRGNFHSSKKMNVEKL